MIVTDIVSLSVVMAHYPRIRDLSMLYLRYVSVLLLRAVHALLVYIIWLHVHHSERCARLHRPVVVQSDILGSSG